MDPLRRADPATVSSRDTSDTTSVRFLGVRIDRVRLPDLLDRVVNAARSNRPTTLLYVNVHCMNVAADNARYRDILERADTVYCDGTGVRLGARMLGLDIPERMTGADWIHDLCRQAIAEGLTLYFLGGEPGVAEDAAVTLRARYPGLRVVGAAPGYGVGPAVVGAINAAGPHILLVGMGTPRQEVWIDENRAELDVPVVWAVGALFEFVAGRIPRGPAWMTEHGLEWLCRMAAEPRKLWKRYLFGNPRFLWRVLQAMRARNW